MIRQRSIKGLGAHVRAYREGSKLVAASRITGDIVPRLADAGFVEPVEEGQAELVAGPGDGRSPSVERDVHRGQPERVTENGPVDRRH